MYRLKNNDIDILQNKYLSGQRRNIFLMKVLKVKNILIYQPKKVYF
jgi:hypothetical protein